MSGVPSGASIRSGTLSRREAGSTVLTASGPCALFRKTTLYGRALAALVPLLPWCERWELSARLHLEEGEGQLRLATGDPLPAAPEPARAEVTTPAVAVKQPVAVKKKVLKRASESDKPEGGDAPDPFAQADTDKADDLMTGDKPQEPKKPEEKKEKGLFDDL